MCIITDTVETIIDFYGITRALRGYDIYFDTK